MKKLILLYSITFSSASFAQTFVQTYQNRVNQITQANINTHLTEFEKLGVKTTGSANNNNTFTWLKNKYISFGYTESQLTENAFTYKANVTKNLILTKTGTKYPETFVIVCGHYDTIVGPGVNDNGSGTSILLEVARILKEVPTEYSIKFINFTGEEQGLLGSQHYVNSVVNSTSPKMNIKMVLNIDEVGGVAGKINNTINCEKDVSNPNSNNAASETITQQLMNCVTLYSPLQTNLSSAYASDYMPFQANGEIITGLFEFNESQKPHTIGDTYVNMDPVYVYNVGKATLGAVQHFSTADLTTLATNDSPKKLTDRISLFPNPAIDFLNIGLDGKGFGVKITDLSGKIVLTSKDEQSLDISRLTNGAYLLTISMNGENATKKFIIKK